MNTHVEARAQDDLSSICRERAMVSGRKRGACRSVGLESGLVRRAADLNEEIPELGFVVSVDRGKLETVGVVFSPADDSGFDWNGRMFNGDLQNQVIFPAKDERGVAEEAASSE